MRVLSKRVSIQICDPQFRLRGKKRCILSVSFGFVVLSLVILVMAACAYPRTQRESLFIRGLNASL